MCEFVLIYYLQKQIGETYERSGRDSTLIRILFVASWILAEILGFGIGIAASNSVGGGAALGLFGVVVVCIVFFVIANSVPAARSSGERGYMDDYNEYRTTGRVSGVPRKRRRRSEDDDEDRPRRRDEEDDEDRPRRRVSSRGEDDEDDRPRRRDEDEDRPRRGDDRVRRRDEEEPKPRRRLREDEEY